MSVLFAGILMVVVVYALLLVVFFAIAMLLPKSFLGPPARAVLTWMPPFQAGEALRNWAAAGAERLARKRLTDGRNGETATLLAAEVEQGAMQAMLPTAGPAELERIVACPEAGQGRVGVSAPEALALAAHLRENRPRAEQQRILGLAREHAKKIAARGPDGGELPTLPCPLHGPDHVCCAYGARPLHCRPLHAIAIAKGLGDTRPDSPISPIAASDGKGEGHEQTVAQGIGIGLARALKSAGVDAGIYELNSALVTAMEMPDAAERWARGEKVFRDALR